MTDDLIETRNTRTGDARKIDEWSVRIPGGVKVKFDVAMKYEHGMCVFLLKSQHPDFKDIALMDADINELKVKLDAYVRMMIEDKLSDGWVPASVVEVIHKLHQPSRASDNLTLRMTIQVRQVEKLAKKHDGNFPVATIRDEYRQETVALRAHSDDFSDQRPKSGHLTNPEVKAWLAHPVSRDGEKGFGRAVIEGDGSKEQAFIKAIERFATGVSDRLTQGRIDTLGFPEPAELMDIVQRAIDEKQV